MFNAAVNEVKKRSPNLRPHFTLGYLSEQDRQVIGFLGEFACAVYFGEDWKSHIRKDYRYADKYDLILKDKSNLSKKYKIDVKTETIPTKKILYRILNKEICDDEPYGRRLIHKYQFENNLHNYDWVIFGAFLRPAKAQGWNPIGKEWYLIGVIETPKILENYKITKTSPFGVTYPEPCVNVRTSELKQPNKRR
ncbi:hypothetical protein [Neisseria zoodegmatis]|nr:hypothetical protein [Neisseria zoodegmatis]OSI09794.1 hypothetical protein BWD10_07345 [Neisseria zoodegmatis]